MTETTASEKHLPRLTRQELSDMLENSVQDFCAEVLRKEGISTGDIAPEVFFRIDEAQTGLLEALVSWRDSRLVDRDPREEATELLGDAAWKGDVEACRRLLAEGADPDAREADGYSALHSAASNGHAEVCRLLAAAGADPNSRTMGGWTALHLAARNGHDEVCRGLIEDGADPNARTDKDMTALHLAAKDGRSAVVSVLLGSGAEVDPRTERNWTPLHIAALNDDAETCHLLARAGADLEARNDVEDLPEDAARNPDIRDMLRAERESRAIDPEVGGPGEKGVRRRI